jgi:hypothetical protein
LGDYSDGIERINIELSLNNKLRLVDALRDALNSNLPLHAMEENISRDELLGNRLTTAQEHLALIGARWQFLRGNLDMPVAEAMPRLIELGAIDGAYQHAKTGETLFSARLCDSRLVEN